MNIARYCSIAITCYVLSGCQPTTFQHELAAPSPKPWSSENFNAHDGDFGFALFGDRTGLARPGVFEQAMTRINLLQPEFVINTGDMIEGYTDDKTDLTKMWDEQDARLATLQMPFFRVVGNHDMGNDLMRDFWNLRYGPDYYSFVYKNVLFIALNTEDPPSPMPEDMRKQLDMIKQMLIENPQKAQAFLVQAMASMTPEMRDKMRNTATPVNFSAKQIDWVKHTLEKNPNVRWTFVFMHKPAWEIPGSGFDKIEALLGNRQFTVFGGHEHNYEHTVRNGHDYVRLATVGGMPHHAPPGNIDHLTLVNFRDGRPHIVNFPLAGVLDIDEPQQQDALLPIKR
jgi:3',5'-cyclic AMP phosphodiesterase CpdA